MRIAALAVVLVSGQAAAQTNRCAIADTTAPAADTELFDQAAGGAAFAKLTGAMIGVRLGQFPADPRASRVHIATGDGQKAYLRVEGWTTASAFRFFAKRDVPLVADHVWLAKGMELQVAAVKDAELAFEHAVLGTRTADGAPLKLRGSIACSSVALAPPPLDSAAQPRGARTYQMKRADLSLFDSPGGSEIFKLQMDDQARKLFWSTEQRGAFVHVTSPGDIVIDAWARVGDLEPLLHAELFDMSTLAPAPLTPKTLALKEPPAMLTAPSELRIVGKADAAAAPLGAVEAGAQFYTMEVSTQWTSVIPSDLAVMPTDAGGFWVKSATLPKP